MLVEKHKMSCTWKEKNGRIRRFKLQLHKRNLIRPQFLFSLIGAAILMSGCAMVGPDFVKPEAPMQQEWMESGDPRVKDEKMDYSQWWTVFNDSVLNTLIDKAYQQNLTLQIAGIRIFEARADLGIATGNLYPQQQAGLVGISRTEVSDNTASSLGVDSPFNSLDLAFDAVWEVDIWGKFRRAVESGVANLESSIASYDDFLVSLTAEVARTYVLIRTLEQRLDIARQNVKIQTRSLQIAEVRFDAGDVSELDVTQARSLLRNTQALIPRLESGLRQAKNGLAILLGILPSEIEEVLGPPGTIPKISSEVFVDIPAELLRRRPDIRLAELQVATQSARIGVAKADLYPHFTLFGTVGLATSSGTVTKAGGADGSDLGDLFESDSLTWDVGTGLSWDIFNYGRIKNRVRVEDARFQQLVVNYEDTVLRAFQEIEDAMVAFLRTQEEEKFLLDSVKAARRSVDLSLLQYREGLIDYQRVLDTQRFLTDQSDALTAASGDVVLNLVALYKALGGGWETRVGKAFISPITREEMQKRTDWGKLLEPAKVQPTALPGDRDKWRWPNW